MMGDLTLWDTAKYGAYTMFCSTIAKIVHFELVQVCYKYYSLLALLNKNFMVLNFFLVSPIYTFHHSQLFSVGFEVFTHPTLRREVIDALEFCQSY